MLNTNQSSNAAEGKSGRNRGLWSKQLNKLSNIAAAAAATSATS